VRAIAGYQPPEGSDEINEAICLARSDIRIKDQVQLLSGHAILLPNSVEDIGYGHRLMRVTFTDPSDTGDEKPALFAAIVDLIDRQVLMARPERPIEATANTKRYE
jgi:hypothetical protein